MYKFVLVTACLLRPPAYQDHTVSTFCLLNTTSVPPCRSVLFACWHATQAGMRSSPAAEVPRVDAGVVGPSASLLCREQAHPPRLLFWSQCRALFVGGSESVCVCHSVCVCVCVCVCMCVRFCFGYKSSLLTARSFKFSGMPGLITIYICALFSVLRNLV